MVYLNTKFATRCAAVLALLLHGLAPKSVFAQTQWSFGYWNGFHGDPVADIQWNGVTHICFQTVWPSAIADGSLTFEDVNGNLSSSQSTFGPFANTVVTAAHAHGVKVILGLNVATGPSWIGATSSANLAGFVSNVMSIINTYGFDGVDIDWESSINYPQMSNLLSSLRSSLGSKALTATMSDANVSFWVGQASKLDRIGLQTYDMSPCCSYSWFNSPLYSDPNTSTRSAKQLSDEFINAGFPASKVEIGLAFYGVTLNGVSGPRQTGYTFNGNQLYYELAGKYNLTGAAWDPVTHTPWLAYSGGYVSFDNAQSLTDKVNYAKTTNLGGWIIWLVDGDYIPSQTPKHPLLAAVANAMGSGGGGSPYTPPSITSTSPLASGTVGTSYSMTVSSSGSTPITWAVTSGALPSGLSLNSSTGVLSGMPSIAASSSFEIEAANAAGNSSRQFSLTVNPKSSTSWFNLVSKNSGLCLDVTGRSTTEDVQLQQWSCSGGSNQKFQLAPVQGGYKITAENSGLQLDVAGGPHVTENGAPVIQWPYWGGTNEIWNTVPNVDGSYSIIVVSSGKCADVTGSSTSNGAKIQQWQCTGGANQQWTLVAAQ